MILARLSLEFALKEQQDIKKDAITPIMKFMEGQLGLQKNGSGQHVSLEYDMTKLHLNLVVKYYTYA